MQKSALTTCLLFLAGPCFGIEYNTTFEKMEQISSVEVKYPVSLKATFPANTCQPAILDITIRLDDLNRKLLRIVRSSGIETNEKCGNKLSLSDAHFFNRSNMLGVKVSGTVGRQECIRTKVPEFRGLKVTMKNRVVASNTFRSDASINANFRPQIINNKLSVSLIGGPQINVNNNLYHSLGRLFNFNTRIRAKLATAINRALGDPGAVLHLPNNLTGLQITYNSMHFITENSQPAIKVRARVDHNHHLFTGFFQHISHRATGDRQNRPQCN